MALRTLSPVTFALLVQLKLLVKLTLIVKLTPELLVCVEKLLHVWSAAAAFHSCTRYFSARSTVD